MNPSRGARGPSIVLLVFGASVIASGCSCVCIRPNTNPPPFPEQARLTVRRTSEPSREPFGGCTGFVSTIGHDSNCSGPWSGSIGEDGNGGGGANMYPMFHTYGYTFQFEGERAQLCRYFGDELGDSNGCTRADVRCASSGELVLHDDGGGHIIGNFEGGGRIEAAFQFQFPVDAGARADSWP